MRGEMVVVKDFRGRALVRRVWDADEKAVYITDDQQFERLSKGEDALMPVGFPKDDVFEYDSAIAESMANGSIDWSKLKLFTKSNWRGTRL